MTAIADTAPSSDLATFIGIVILILLLTIPFTLWKLLKEHRRTNELLEHQNELMRYQNELTEREQGILREDEPQT